MAGLLSDIDPDGLLEFSVVYTDRALNHMSQKFQGVMKDISSILKEVYQAPSSVLVPGSGTFGMEAVARQFAHGQKVMVIRNGWFSYRWSQIFDMGQIPSESIVVKARQLNSHDPQSSWIPAPIEEVVAAIALHKPAVVFAPHVETSAGMILPDDYLRSVSDAVHQVGGLLILDCIASGAMWVNMASTGVDVLVSAPQKGWSGSPCCAMVMLSERARTAIEGTTSSSFSCDLKKWLQIMETYEKGGHVYHTTMPTDALKILRDRNYLIFFIASILICIPLAFYYGQANQFLNEVGMQQAAAKMTMGQIAETIFLFLMPWFFVRFGTKQMILIGMLAWILRYALFSYGDAGSNIWMLYAGIILHGICYDFFFVTGQIYTDQVAGPRVRSSAQGLITLATYGVGMYIGFYLAGSYVDKYKVGESGHDWPTIWLFPCLFAAGVALMFLSFFRNNKKKTIA